MFYNSARLRDVPMREFAFVTVLLLWYMWWDGICAWTLYVWMYKLGLFLHCISLNENITAYRSDISWFFFCISISFCLLCSLTLPQTHCSHRASLHVWPSLISALCMRFLSEPFHPFLSQASFCFNETDAPSLIKTCSTIVMKAWTRDRRCRRHCKYNVVYLCMLAQTEGIISV